jgi:prolyl-tRNA editing enzyme YbaK/EbsC (Cys-tRNA(Pro) deacylase)
VGEVGKATADDVRAATSFAIGGVPPVVSAPRLESPHPRWGLAHSP